MPAGFEVAEPDVSDLDAFTAYGEPDGSLLIGINVTPGTLLDGIAARRARGAARSPASVPGAETARWVPQGRDVDGGVRRSRERRRRAADGSRGSVVALAGPDAPAARSC